MNILHISLGNPKFHYGGLNRYCLDLMEQQIEEGHFVNLLYAGDYFPIKKTRIRKKSKYMYKIIGALPVPLLYGIDVAARYMRKVDINAYDSFLKELCPDIIHVHSIMGIHKEFFQSASSMNIPMIFTTHDYYPICFKCMLIDMNEDYCQGIFCEEKCALCNKNRGLKPLVQFFIQSDLYPYLKNCKGIRLLKKKKSSILKERRNAVVREYLNKSNTFEFRNLHDYYAEIMNNMACIHCNSDIAMDIYKRSYPNLNYQVLPITHAALIRSKHHRLNRNILKISYFGGRNKHKGYQHVREVIEWLISDSQIQNWEFNLYGDEYEDIYEDNRVNIKGYFSFKEEENFWMNTDLLLYPSQWPETFGYGVLEALAHGVPVICSDLVGAKNLLYNIKEYCIYDSGNVLDLQNKVRAFADADFYEHISACIADVDLNLSMSEHNNNIIQIYEKVRV